MLKILIKNQLRMYLYSFLGKGRTRKKQSKGMAVVFAFLMIYLVGYFSFMFGMFFTALVEPLTSLHMEAIYFAMAALMALALMVLGSVFTTKVQLYDAKDNELLLALPIKPKDILASRMVVLLIYNLFFECMVVAPAGIVYCAHVSVSVGGVLRFLLLFLGLPFFAFAISGFIGWIIAILTKNIRNKTPLTMAFSLIFFVAYFYICTRMNSIISSITTVGLSVAGNLKKFAPLFWFGRGITEGNILDILLSMLCLLVPFVLIYVILSKSFISIATAKKGGPRVAYKEKAMKAGSIGSALLAKEFRKFGASSVYMMNSGMGIIFMVIGAVLLIVKKKQVNVVLAGIAAGFPGMNSYLTLVIICAITFFSSMIIITAPSISLEGKQIWIYKSIPVRTKDILNAKTKMHMIVAMPALILIEIAAIVVIPMNVVDIICLFLAPFLFTLFCADYGLMCNLKHPRLDWVNEAQAVKQSSSVLISMLVYMGLSVTLGILMVALAAIGLPVMVIEIIFTLLCGGLSLLTRKRLMKKGVRLFQELE